MVLRNQNNQNLEASLKQSKVDLLIIEIAQASAGEVDLVKWMRSQFPYVIVMLVNGNGNREVIAKAFSDGIVDAFHRPYDPHLIAERALAILRQMDNP